MRRRHALRTKRTLAISSIGASRRNQRRHAIPETAATSIFVLDETRDEDPQLVGGSLRARRGAVAHQLADETRIVTLCLRRHGRQVTTTAPPRYDALRYVVRAHEQRAPGHDAAVGPRPSARAIPPRWTRPLARERAPAAETAAASPGTQAVRPAREGHERFNQTARFGRRQAPIEAARCSQLRGYARPAVSPSPVYVRPPLRPARCFGQVRQIAARRIGFQHHDSFGH